MAEWTDQLFDKLAAKTKLGPQTLDACRRVLVPHALSGGHIGVEQGVDVAKDMGLFPAQISRGVSNLRRQLVELGDVSEEHDYRVERSALKAEVESSRDVAVAKAREMYPDLVIKDVQRGQTYIGKPLVKTPQHLVQSTGKPGEAVIHDLTKLQRVPDMNFPMLEVRYPSRGGLAEVQETVPGQVRGGRSR